MSARLKAGRVPVFIFTLHCDECDIKAQMRGGELPEGWRWAEVDPAVSPFHLCGPCADQYESGSYR